MSTESRAPSYDADGGAPEQRGAAAAGRLLRVFVSFTESPAPGCRPGGLRGPGPDFVAARQILCRLNDHPVAAWMNRSASGMIPLGCNWLHYCREMIDRSDAFVVVVSPRSFASDAVRAELSYALAAHDAGHERPMIPIILDPCPPFASWPAPFDRLRPFIGRRVPASGRQPPSCNKSPPGEAPPLAFAPDDVFERAVFDVLATLGLERQYAPAADLNPSLPFRRRLALELKTAVAHDPDDAMGSYRAWTGRAAVIEREYSEADRDPGRLARVIRLLDGLPEYLRLDFPDARFYFVELTRATVRAELGRHRLADGDVVAGRRCLHEARQIVNGLLADAACGRLREDEDAHALVGFIEMQHGNTAGARAAYRTAWDVLVRRVSEQSGAGQRSLDTLDAALAFNLLLVDVLAGAPLDHRSYRQLVGAEGVDTLGHAGHIAPEDVPKFKVLQAMALVAGGRLTGGRAELASALAAAAECPEMVLHLADAVADAARRSAVPGVGRRAVRIITSVSSCVPHPFRPFLLHRRARLLFDLRDFRRCLDDCRELTAGSHRTGLWIERAIASLFAQVPHEARKACETALAIPLDAAADGTVNLDQIYDRGYANWLLGRLSEARHAFRDSGRGPADWYELLWPGELLPKIGLGRPLTRPSA